MTDNEKVEPQIHDLSLKPVKILSRVIDLYHTAFCEDARAKEYLLSRGITDNALFAYFKIGFSNGTLFNVLPVEDLTSAGDLEDNNIRLQLKKIGVLNEEGEEALYGYVIVPLYDLSGNPCGLYGRHIDGMIQEGASNHIHLLGSGPGLFNWQTVKSHKEIILTGSIIDALILINAGIRNTITCYGDNLISQDHLKLFKQYGVKTVFLCLGAEVVGKNATDKIAARLMSAGLITHIINIPKAYDLNHFFSFNANLKKKFKELLHQADPGWNKPSKTTVPKIVSTEYGFNMNISGRAYEVRGVSRNPNKLKATVKGIKEDKGKIRFHVDTVDFYSARSLTFLIKGLSDLFGEEMNKLLCYVAAVSRKIEDPLSVMIQSRSAAGKSFLQDTVLSIVPDDDYIKYTRLTDQALFYKDKDSLAHIEKSEKKAGRPLENQLTM